MDPSLYVRSTVLECLELKPTHERALRRGRPLIAADDRLHFCVLQNGVFALSRRQEGTERDLAYCVEGLNQLQDVHNWEANLRASVLQKRGGSPSATEAGQLAAVSNNSPTRR